MTPLINDHLTCMHTYGAHTADQQWTPALIIQEYICIQGCSPLCATIEHHLWYHGLSALRDVAVSLRT